MKRKLITFLTVVAIVMLLVPSNIYAKMDTQITMNKNAAGSSMNEINRVGGTVQVIGSVVSVLALIIIGIRYMISSTEEKANIKGVMACYVVGAVLVFATTGFLSFAYKVISKIK